jgi:hypothetical protein
MDDNDLKLCGWTRGQIGWDYGLAGIHGCFEYTNGKRYFFDGTQYSRITNSPYVDIGYPKVIADEWKGWPTDWADGVDAAMVYASKASSSTDTWKAYFFKGGEYLRYTPGGGVDKGYPKKIADEWKNWPVDWAGGIDAAVGRPDVGRAYFFRGADYLRYEGKVLSGYPKKIADEWKKWPADWVDGIDSVMYYNDKYYFFKGREYLRYTPGVGVDDGYPRGIPEAWPGLLTWAVNRTEREPAGSGVLVGVGAVAR